MAKKSRKIQDNRQVTHIQTNFTISNAETNFPVDFSVEFIDDEFSVTPISYRKSKNGKPTAGSNDVPKSFTRILNFMAYKESRGKQSASNGKIEKGKNQQKKKKQQMLKIRDGETFQDFNRRVKVEVSKELAQIQTVKFRSSEPGSQKKSKKSGDKSQSAENGAKGEKDKYEKKRKVGNGQSNDGNGGSDEGEHSDSNLTRKQRNQKARREKQKAKKQARQKSPDSFGGFDDSAAFNQYVDAPPVFKNLPKAKLKDRTNNKAKPAPNSSDVSVIPQNNQGAINKMVMRTARITPLDKLNESRKKVVMSNAQKQELEKQRIKAINTYRAIKSNPLNL